MKMILGRYPPRYTARLSDDFPRIVEGLNYRGVRYAPVVDSQGRYAGLIRLPAVMRVIHEYYTRGCLEELCKVRASELTDSRVPSINVEAITPSKVVELMVKHDVGGIAITSKNGYVMGEVTEKELIDLAPVANISGVKIKDLMTPNPATVEALDPISKVLEVMCRLSVRRVPVTYEGELVGITTVRDLIRFFNRIIEEKGGIAKEDVETQTWHVATPRVSIVNEEDDVSKLIKIMRIEGIGGAIVVDDEKKVVGIVTERDVLSRIPGVREKLDKAAESVCRSM